MLVVPIPNDITRARVNRLCPNVTWNAELGEVSIAHSVFGNQSGEISLAEFWTVHANRVLANIDESPNTVCLEDGDNLIGLSARISEGEEVGFLGRPRVIPNDFVFKLLLYRNGRQIQPVGLRHGFSLSQTPLDDAVLIFVPFEGNIRFQTMNPLVVRKRLWQFRRGSDFCPRQWSRFLQRLLYLVPKTLIGQHRCRLPWAIPIRTFALWTNGGFPLAVGNPLVGASLTSVTHHGNRYSCH